MNEISTHFCIIEPDIIRDALFSGADVSYTHDIVAFSSKGKILFSQDHSSDNNGLSWSQTFRAVVGDRNVMNYCGRRVYVGVFRTDGTIFVIGTATETPMLVVTPHENAYVVETNFETTTPVEI